MINISFFRCTSKLALLLGTSALLSACSTLGFGEAKPQQNDHVSRIDLALQRAANAASVNGNSNESLSYLETIYKRNSHDPKIAIRYATALREAGSLKQADLVLAPFANGADSTAELKSEYAALLLSMGNYEMAEKYAQKAVLQDNSYAQAYHHLGVALDAQGMHEPAERAFRKGLELWQGDPTAIMNNLALNLAAQGYFEESYEILGKARDLSPEKIEIERNMRIIKAMQQTEQGWVPKPTARPSS